MTFVGKLLVIIQLVLTICFMLMAGAVYTRHQTWQDQAKKLSDALDQSRTDFTRLEEEFKNVEDNLTEQLKNAKDDAEDAENRVVQRDRTIATQQVELETLKTSLNTEEALAKIAGDEASNRRDESLVQREINETLNRELNEKNAIVRQQEDELFNREVEMRQIKSRYQILLSTVAIYRKVLASNGFDTDPQSYARENAPTPLVFGEVLETRRSSRSGQELIEVSIGSDDGVKKGTVLYVYRVGERSKYLGEIRLELVQADKAVGVVVNKAKNGVIEKKDYVATRL